MCHPVSTAVSQLPPESLGGVPQQVALSPRCPAQQECHEHLVSPQHDQLLQQPAPLQPPQGMHVSPGTPSSSTDTMRSSECDNSEFDDLPELVDIDSECEAELTENKLTEKALQGLLLTVTIHNTGVWVNTLCEQVGKMMEFSDCLQHMPR